MQRTKRRRKSTRAWKEGSSAPLQGAGAEEEGAEGGQMEEEDALAVGGWDGTGEGLGRTV